MTAKNLGTYGHHFQAKVLYSLLNDKHFLKNISDILSSDYFESAAHRWIVDYILSYYSKYNTYPTMEVLRVEYAKIKDKILKVAVKEALKHAYTSTTDDIEYVKEEFFNFCKNQKLKDALLKSVDLLENGLYEDIWSIMKDAVKSGFDKNIGHEYDKDVETRYREDVKAQDFPWPILNNLTDGGLNEDSLMIIFAPPGIGKTTLCCIMAAHAAKQGKKVVYYTLELSEKYVGKKIDSILTGIEVKKLKLHRKEVERAIGDLGGKLLIKEYSPKRASLDTIESHLSFLENNMDFRPDLIVIDYPDLLRPRKSRDKISEESDDVYSELKGLCKERLIPVIAPSQINRTGARDAVIEGDKVAGSYGKIMIADFGLAIARPRKMKLTNRAVATIIKSRLGPDGDAFIAITDLSKNQIEITSDRYDESSDGVTPEEEVAEENQLKKKVAKRLNLVE